MNSIAFQPHESARFADAALKKSIGAMDRAQQCAVLWFGDIMQRRLYRELGYSSINQYARVELEFSKREPVILSSWPAGWRRCPKCAGPSRAGILATPRRAKS